MHRTEKKDAHLKWNAQLKLPGRRKIEQKNLKKTILRKLKIEKIKEN